MIYLIFTYVDVDVEALTLDERHDDWADAP